MGELLAFLFLVATVCIIVIATWKIFALIGAVLLVASAITGIIKAGDTGLQRRRQRESALIARADKQHNQIMSGDEINGTYGEYLPPPELR